MYGFSSSFTPPLALNAMSATGLLCLLIDAIGTMENDPCPKARAVALQRARTIRPILADMDVPAPDLHPLEERAAHGQLPQDFADVHQSGAVPALSVILAHGGSLVEVV